MTAKEFVKNVVSKARAEKQVTNGGKVYWLIRDGRNTMYIATGKTESNAWVEAKKQIETKNIKQNKIS